MKNTRLILRTIFIVGLVILIMNYIFRGFDVEVFTQWQNWAVVFLYVSVLTTVNTFYFHLLEKKLNWEVEKKKRLVVGIAGSAIVSMIAYFLCRIVHLVYILQEFSLKGFLKAEKPADYLVVLLVVIIISLFFHVLYLYKYTQESKVQEQKIIAGTVSAKFDALKNQLDPHFLFNSLNVLTSLIEENPTQAQKFTTSLSKVYRYVLEQKNKELVSVEEELSFARTYIDLLKMRFENSIQCEIPENLSNPEAKIVPLSLQLLLENAVKHNQVSQENPLVISIYESEGNLIIKNNLQPKNIIKKSSGIGLLNIKQRYALLTSRKVVIQLSHEENWFMVSLPMLTKQILVMNQKAENMENISYEKMKRARKKVEEVKSFYGNLTSYCIIIPFLIIVNLLTTDFLWFFFPMLGWGLGVLFHYMNTFNKNPFFGKNWEQRKIREFMEKDNF